MTNRYLLQLANPPVAPELGPYIIPSSLWCPNARDFYQPATHHISAPGIIQTWCPLCDWEKRTSSDQAYNYRKPMLHTYFLERMPGIAQVKRILPAVKRLQAIANWRQN